MLISIKVLLGFPPLLEHINFTDEMSVHVQTA